MDDSRKPGNSAPAKFPWQNDDGAGEQNLGATSVFETTPKSSIHSGPDRVTQVSEKEHPGETGELRGSAPQAAASVGLQEPIVHKVVLGGSATAQMGILGLLRTGSRKDESSPAEPQSCPSMAALEPAVTLSRESFPKQSSEGFTQLLRSLSGDSSPASAKQPEIVKRTVASSDSGLTTSESGFTELMRAPNPADLNERPEKRADFRESTPSAPPSDETGGFTALLHGFSGPTPNPPARQPKLRKLDENSDPILPGDRPTPHTNNGPVYSSGQAAPGAFTQLFRTLGSEAEETNRGGADTPVTYPEHDPGDRSSSDQTSLTQLFSTHGEKPYRESAFGDNRLPALEDDSPQPFSGREDSLGSSHLPTGVTDWSRATATSPEFSSGSGGLTQFLRALDQPAREPEMPIAYPPANAPAPTSVSCSLFTQTYSKLDESVEPVSPPPPPYYSPPSELSATRHFEPQTAGGTSPDPWPPARVAPNLTAGPSEVTRILDASKLREMQRQEMPGSATINPVAPAQPAPPQFSAAAPPAPPHLQWQPPVPPAPVPAQPPHFGGGMQVPQYTPPAPMPQMAAPAPPPVMGKLQPYVPLMLIIIIFLLVVILVTVVFLLKH